MKNLSVAALGLLVAVLSLRGFAAPALPAFAASAVSVTPSFPNPNTKTATASITPTLTATATRTITATATATATPTATVTATLDLSATTPTTTPTITPTPFRYPLSLDAQVLSIDALRARPYGSGPIKITRTVFTGDAYSQYLIEYPSDGLRIIGTMNVPRSIGPFPVVVMDHGYFKPAEYKTGDGTSRAADAFARHGYLTIASDYRCYAGSQCGPDPFYTGYAIDVLNLIAELPSLPDADTARVGIWGHSMGGGITIRVITVNASLKVAALYGALSSDDEVHYCWLYGCRTPLVTPIPRNSSRLLEFDPEFFQGLPTPPPDNAATDPKARLHEIFLKSSPSRYLQYIDTPLIIHHGESDEIVPIEWSVDLADRLNALGKTATLYTYPGEGHVFAGWGWQLFMSRTLTYFDQYLKPRAAPITVDRRVLMHEQVAEESNY